MIICHETHEMKDQLHGTGNGVAYGAVSAILSMLAPV